MKALKDKVGALAATAFDLVAARLKAAEAERVSADVYQYDTIPRTLRVQVCHILDGAIGSGEDFRDAMQYYREPGKWKKIQNALLRKKGVFSLSGDLEHPREDCLNFLLEADAEDALLGIVQNEASSGVEFGRELVGGADVPDRAERVTFLVATCRGLATPRRAARRTSSRRASRSRCRASGRDSCRAADRSFVA